MNVLWTHPPTFPECFVYACACVFMCGVIILTHLDVFRDCSRGLPLMRCSGLTASILEVLGLSLCLSAALPALVAGEGVDSTSLWGSPFTGGDDACRGGLEAAECCPLKVELGVGECVPEAASANSPLLLRPVRGTLRSTLCLSVFEGDPDELPRSPSISDLESCCFRLSGIDWLDSRLSLISAQL